ncbi:MAG: arginase family protein, partial [Bacteriovoracia bacterium]
MTTIIDQSLSARAQESVAARFISTPPPEARVVSLALSSSDVGVQRNGGRMGSRLGPQALVATFKKLALPQENQATFFLDQVVSEQVTEERDYFLSIQQQIANLRRLSTQHDLIHLGGGHDHIYPLLCSLGDGPIVVINVDAHLDTRTDTAPHSGNPFRRFA